MGQRVNIYSYVAAANPCFARGLAHKYRYVHDPSQPLASVLEQLVAFEGKPVLMDILENGPDKDAYMEYFEEKYGKKPEGCQCGSKSNQNIDGFMNFSGQMIAQQSENRKITSETNLMLLAGAVLIAFAIISTKKP
jgi:hypothetical protein